MVEPVRMTTIVATPLSNFLFNVVNEHVYVKTRVMSGSVMDIINHQLDFEVMASFDD